MPEDKVAELMKKLEKSGNKKEDSKKEEKEKTEEKEDKEESKEKKEDKKEETGSKEKKEEKQKPSPEIDEDQERAIQELTKLHDNGIFRAELLNRLMSIDKSLYSLNSILIKALGLDKDVKKEKQE
ncbi:MAG: hypothetical protein ACOC56_01510 [Atribacterota bacterium]